MFRPIASSLLPFISKTHNPRVSRVKNLLFTCGGKISHVIYVVNFVCEPRSRVVVEPIECVDQQIFTVNSQVYNSVKL